SWSRIFTAVTFDSEPVALTPLTSHTEKSRVVDGCWMSPPPSSLSPPRATEPFDSSTMRPSDRKSSPMWPNAVLGTVVITTRGLGDPVGKSCAMAPTVPSRRAAANLREDLVTYGSVARGGNTTRAPGGTQV